MNIGLGKLYTMIFKINIISADQQLMYTYIHIQLREMLCLYKVQENYIPPRDHMGGYEKEQITKKIV